MKNRKIKTYTLCDKEQLTVDRAYLKNFLEQTKSRIDEYSEEKEYLLGKVRELRELIKNNKAVQTETEKKICRENGIKVHTKVAEEMAKEFQKKGNPFVLNSDFVKSPKAWNRSKRKKKDSETDLQNSLDLKKQIKDHLKEINTEEKIQCALRDLSSLEKKSKEALTKEICIDIDSENKEENFVFYERKRELQKRMSEDSIYLGKLQMVIPKSALSAFLIDPIFVRIGYNKEAKTMILKFSNVSLGLKLTPPKAIKTKYFVKIVRVAKVLGFDDIASGHYNFERITDTEFLVKF